MDHDQWRLIMSHIRRIAASLPRPSKRFDYSDAQIVAMFIWSVAHDRPMIWACDRRHYNRVFRPRQLPSVSQFHRRVKSERVRLILQRLHEVTGGVLCPTALQYIDGKPLPVGNSSKDRDARIGYAGRRMGIGYKLHVIATEDRRITCWCVRPMNEHEMPIARLMLEHLPEGTFTQRSLILADGNYDSHDLYKDVHKRGARLVTHLRGRATHPATLRQMGPARRELLELNKTSRPLVKMIQRNRNEIELTLSNLTSYGGGLGPLPSFVRRLPRVTRWVGVKIVLYHTRLCLRRRAEKNN